MITLKQAQDFCKNQSSKYEQKRKESTDFSKHFELLRVQKEWEHLYAELNILEGYMKENGISD